METSSGRRNQKYRTRRALLAAARQLLERKELTTVATAAAEAMISKATAYRYFSTSEALIREALLDAVWRSPELVIGDAADVRERVRRVHIYLFEHTRQNEMAHRLFLSKALDTWVSEGGKPTAQLRGARRLPMFELALEPVRHKLPHENFEALIVALSSTSGIETFIALKDVCGVDDQTADRISWSTIEAILDKALA